MNSRQRHIASLTRDRSFLIRTALVIGAVFFAIGTAVFFLRSGPGDPSPRSQRQLDTSGSAFGIATALRYTSVLDAASSPSDAVRGRIEKSDLSAGEKQLLTLFADALAAPSAEQPDFIPGLQSHPAAGEHPALAAGCAAYLHALAGDNSAALELYTKAGAHPDASFERAAALRIATATRDADTLEALLGNPDFAADTPFEIEDEIAILKGDFAGLLANQFAAEVRHFYWPAALVALVGGVAWFVIIFQTTALERRHVPTLLGAVGLGIASGWLTLALYALQTFYTGVAETGAIIDDIIYNFAGTAVREEFSKLACFALLLPLLLKARSPALAFAAATATGLGFAVAENHGYFVRNLADDATARFLTATYAHAALTGIVGYHAYRAACDFRRNWEAALGSFLLAVFLHGAHNFLPNTIPEISRELWVASIFIIGILAFMHFRIAATVRRHERRQMVSPLGVFVLGAATTVGSSFVVFAFLATNPFHQALADFGTEALALVPVAFLFINQFRSE